MNSRGTTMSKGMTMYQEFLKSKEVAVPAAGINPVEPHKILYPFQRDIVKWALRRGRCCIFADCGMGKTLMQIEWARQIPGRVLILAPLAVAQQTVREGEKVQCPIAYARHESESTAQITITNYEMMEHFDLASYAGIVLDESSIIKHYDGKFRNLIISSFRNTPYRLACTATPAPNDHMELGNHSEFVGAMPRTEMLSMFFVHDGGDTSKWRIKGHAQTEFWKWVCSWAVMIRKPSDLGYANGEFILPRLNIIEDRVEHEVKGEYLFAMEAQTLQERIRARKDSTNARVDCASGLVNGNKDTWLIWCNLNAEADALESAIEGAKQVKGSDSLEVKSATLQSFSRGELRVLITKPSIAGFGMNWQHCHNVIFVGLSDSWEEYYQAVRRCWRFGQREVVKVHIVTSTAEGQVVTNIKRKEVQAAIMADEMVEHMHSMNSDDVRGTAATHDEYTTDCKWQSTWTCHKGDCVDVVSKLPDETIDFSVFSPPFASLYTYSASERDMGNSKNYSQFSEHFRFLVKHLYRVLKPGRLVSFHCMNLPTTKTHHGYIGIQDFRGDLIRWFQSEGFIYHSEVCIWKDPVTAMQRTKALGLLWKQIQKDSAMCRQGVPDYLVTMRKPGDNPNPVSHTKAEFPVEQWQRWASPVWMDINPSDTLQFRSVRSDKDERHICPLQLEVIRRAINLWSNKGDMVLSPFAGIGSEGVVALEEGRKFIGVELKDAYWKQACANLDVAAVGKADDLFADVEPDTENNT